jgi:hypothetical protein
LQGPFIFLFIVGMIVLVLGIVGLFKPLVNLRMANRKWAGAWIMGGFVVMMVAAVNAPPTIADTPNQGEGQIEPAMRESAAIDACYEVATTDAATARCDAQWKAWSDRIERDADTASERYDREMAEMDRRRECIRRELGERYDDATQAEIIAASIQCGAN